MEQSSNADTITSIANAVEKIGNSKWLGFLIFGFGALILYTGYEHRNDIFAALAANSASWYVMGVAALIGFISWNYQRQQDKQNASQERQNSRYDTELQNARDTITSLHREIADCRAECRAETRQGLADVRAAIEAMTRAVITGDRRNGSAE